jgi:hypothetical protein
MKRAVRTSVVLAAAVLAVGASCSSIPDDARIGIIAPDDSVDAFGPVARFLDHRCGSLDCHGQMTRNLRIWGCEGMRLDPNAISQCSRNLGGTDTTNDEIEATYRSLVGLEPTVMSTVVAGHGQHPELLTFVRKARGIESHKGGALITPGDFQDVCITTWLAGENDANHQSACASAISFPTFPGPDASTD